MKRPVVTFLATGAYTGYSPFAPGTVGSVWGLVIAYLVSGLGPLGSGAVTVLVCLVSIPVAGAAIPVFGRKDPSEVTIDEVAGMLVGMYMLPLTLLNVILAFLIFRIFDIVKPWPAGALDRGLDGGAGIVLDDIASGVYTLICMQILVRFIF